MLRKNKQRRYLAKKEKQWRQELKAFGASQDDEALHRLRVALKKMKAFARFSTACSGKDSMKDFDPLKKVFHQAGTIRDAGNHIHLLEHFHPAPDTYKKEQEHIQHEASDRFVGQLDQYGKQGKKAGRRLLADIRAIRFGCIRDWYGRQLIGVAVGLTASGNRLHKSRKKIKELLYVLSFLPSRLVRRLRLNEDYLDRLQDAIGQWHDAMIVASEWAGKDLAGSQAMVRECHQKEAAVRELAGDFYRRAHLD
ncbi:MAG TPA: CHAD domain-containing protein [Puia sp.]|nr:CHAD domain-containing protein [Puia sp.]